MSNQPGTVAVMCFSGGTGGMERSAVRLADFLSRLTCVVLVCKQGSFVERLYKEGNYRFDCETVHFHSRKFSFSMLGAARRVVRMYAVKNVIFFGASELKTLYFSFRRQPLNLIVWHGTTKSHPKRDFLHRLVYSDVNVHVALSDHLINNVKTIVPETPGACYKVIRPSFDFDVKLFDKTELTGPIQILHVGRIAAGKGQLDAIRASENLVDKTAGDPVDFRLSVVGTADGSDYIQLVEEAYRISPAKDRITLLGYVESVNPFLENADILLFPSRGEGMPNAFIEALHYNIVCIAYENTVFPEFQKLGFHVHLVEDGNIDALAEKLRMVASNIQNEKRQAEHNMQLARRLFSVERELNDWLEVLK